MSGITFTGSSGRNYSYLIFDPTNERQMLQSGDNLKRSFLTDNKELWELAQDVHGATLLLIHPGAERGASAREQEKIDLIERYHPPLNSRASELR
jgi:hypothetical protein